MRTIAVGVDDQSSDMSATENVERYRDSSALVGSVCGLDNFLGARAMQDSCRNVGPRRFCGGVSENLAEPSIIHDD